MKIEQLKNDCTGCTACTFVCPKQCITMKPDAEGFYFPVIDKNLCIACGKCDSVCHCLHEASADMKKTSYYGFLNDADLRHKSTSGGAFTALAESILSAGGTVYGAAFDYKTLTLRHCASEQVGLDALRKSKYIESDLGDTFRCIQKDLDAGKAVLFCGAPCQVRGLKQVISDPNHLLLTLDFICHGVPSAILFQEHLRAIHPKGEIKEVDFRPKEYGWSSKNLKTVTDKKTRCVPHTLDLFYAGFMTHNAFLRRSCYTCRYRSERWADITIADFWGWREIDKTLNDEKGLSLLVANHDKGRQALAALKGFTLTPIQNKFSDYAYKERDYSSYLLIRSQFYKFYQKYGFEKAAKKTYMPHYNLRRTKYSAKKLIKRLLGRSI